MSGLKIWSVEQYLAITPLLQHFVKKNKFKQLPKNYYHEANQQWQKSNKKFPKIENVPLIEIASYATASEKLTAGDYDGDFMERVKEANFFMFCD